MSFFDLSEQAQKRAWLLQCWALNDQPENILSFSEYGAMADWNGTQFKKNGEAI
jgi:hypothetical protein